MISRLLVLPLILFAIKTNADLAWESPAAGDVYIPGDTLQAVWTSTDNVISPSFTICAADNGTDSNDAADCGTAVWPSVTQNGTEYSISFAVPNVTGNGDYYLVMKDDQGTTYDTPDFSLALTNVNTTADANATSSLIPTRPTTSISYLPSHSASTVAAIAVPLSLVAATLLVALLLFFFRIRQSKKRERERKEARASEKQGSQQSAVSFASAADIERAVLALAAVRGYGGQEPHIYGPPQPPVGANVPASFGTPSLGATVAALLGISAFNGLAHGIGQPPASAPHYAVGSDVVSTNQQHPIHVAPAPVDLPVLSSQHEGAHCDQKTAHTSSQSSACERPQLPEIRIKASSPSPHSTDSPLPPPKQLFPGSSPGNALLSYDDLYAFASKLPDNTSTDLSQSRGEDSHVSLSVVSDYTQASPTLPHGGSNPVPPVSDRFPNTLRVLQPSLTRMRSLRRLETIPESGKHLPTRPEGCFGPQLYEAVSRAVGQ